MKIGTIVKIGVGVAAVVGIGYLIYKGAQKVRDDLHAHGFPKEGDFDNFDGCKCCECPTDECDCGCECLCHTKVDEEPVEKCNCGCESHADATDVVAEEKSVEEKAPKAKKDKAAKAE